MPCRVASPSPLTGGFAMVITATEPWTLYSAVMVLLFLGKWKKNGRAFLL
jgi:hypothetical protein